MAQVEDNSGMGMVVGILLAVFLIIGGFYFFKANGAPAHTSVTNIEMPDVKVDAPPMPAPAPAPAEDAQ